MSRTQRKPVTRIGAERLVVGGVETIHLDLMDRLARLVRDMHPDHIWTVKMVAEELVAAVKLCNRIAGAVGPSDKQVAWPQVLREWSDFLAMVETDEIAKDKPPQRITPTSRQVSRMERSLGWIGEHLARPEHDAMRRVLSLWLRCKASRKRTFSDALKRKRWSKATAYRCRDRALLIIAIGLMERGVLP